MRAEISVSSNSFIPGSTWPGDATGGHAFRALDAVRSQTMAYKLGAALIMLVEQTESTVFIQLRTRMDIAVVPVPKPLTNCACCLI